MTILLNKQKSLANGGNLCYNAHRASEMSPRNRLREGGDESPASGRREESARRRTLKTESQPDPEPREENGERRGQDLRERTTDVRTNGR